MKKESFKERKIRQMEYFFGEAYRDFMTQDPHDDRRVYINIYNKIVEALNSLPKNPNNYVCVAMINAIDADLETLEDIGRRFGRTDYIFNK